MSKRMYKIKPTAQQAVDFLNMLILAQVTRDVAERLEGSPFDVKAIKMHMNGFKQAVNQQNNITNDVFGIDTVASQAIYNHLAEFVSDMLKLDPLQWQYLTGLHDLLVKHPNDSKTIQIFALIKNAHEQLGSY